MDDKQIVALYLERSEQAISETKEKYGNYCHSIAFNILRNVEDSEECVNDTYMKAWNAIPPQTPEVLSAFLGKITRNLALNRHKYYTAEKRGSGQVVIALEELHECLTASDSTEQIVEDEILIEIFNRFLATRTSKVRKIFMRRYWYLSSIKEIANDFKITESNTKMILLRARNDLKEILKKEGIYL